MRLSEPNQLRWSPPPLDEAGVSERNFVQGLETYAGAGEPTMKSGVAVHYYRAGASMRDTGFMNADGDFLIVPQEGDLDIQVIFCIFFLKNKIIRKETNFSNIYIFCFFLKKK